MLSFFLSNVLRKRRYDLLFLSTYFFRLSQRPGRFRLLPQPNPNFTTALPRSTSFPRYRFPLFLVLHQILKHSFAMLAVFFVRFFFLPGQRTCPFSATQRPST